MVNIRKLDLLLSAHLSDVVKLLEEAGEDAPALRLCTLEYGVEVPVERRGQLPLVLDAEAPHDGARVVGAGAAADHVLQLVRQLDALQQLLVDEAWVLLLDVLK